MCDQASNAKMSGDIGAAECAAPESNIQGEARMALNTVETAIDLISSLRNRLDPVLRPENLKPGAVPTAVDSSIMSPAAYEFRNIRARADSLSSQIGDLLNRLDL